MSGTHEVMMLSREAIRPSPHNPRRHWDEGKLRELAASIEQKGILSPLLVRPLPTDGMRDGERYELVAGERRWRAAGMCGADQVPCLIREMDDQEAVELQAIENLQREDLTPIEEAECYAQLCKFRTQEEVARRVGKTQAVVAKRLKLLELSPLAKDALEQGKLTIEVAGAIARIANGKLRSAALEAVIKPRFREEDPLTQREALEMIREKFTCDLRRAPFDTKDDGLLQRAGSCESCPKRSGNCGELFDLDGDGGHWCTDPLCFSEKKDAEWARRAAAAAESGASMLSDKEAAKVFPYSNGELAWGCGYVRLEDRPAPEELKDPEAVEKAARIEPGERQKLLKQLKRPPQWRALIDGLGVPLVLARDGSGEIHELVKRDVAVEAVRHAAKAAGREHIFADRVRSPYQADHGAQQKRERARRDKEQVQARAIVGRLVSAIECRKAPGEFWALMVGQALRHANIPACSWVLRRRGLPHKDALAEIRALADGLGDDKGRMALAVELLLAEQCAFVGPRGEGVEEWCEVYDIDVEKVASAAWEAHKQGKKTGDQEPGQDVSLNDLLDRHETAGDPAAPKTVGKAKRMAAAASKRGKKNGRR